MNMFKSVKATNIKEYFDQLPSDRKPIIEEINKFIIKTAPRLKPNFTYNMLGYGTFKYLNNKKESLDWPVIGLANQKNYISLYVCSIDKNQYVAEKYKEQLGKVSVGKSCIRFKKIEDLNLETLEKVIKLAAKSPGLTKD